MALGLSTEKAAPVLALFLGRTVVADGATDTMVVGQTELESEVASLIVEAVNLETPPEALDPDTRLFGEGLGLDSIDLLEVALAVSRKYGFQLRSDDPDNERIFSSLRALSVHIAQHRTR